VRALLDEHLSISDSDVRVYQATARSAGMGLGILLPARVAERANSSLNAATSPRGRLVGSSARSKTVRVIQPLASGSTPNPRLGERASSAQVQRASAAHPKKTTSAAILVAQPRRCAQRLL